MITIEAGVLARALKTAASIVERRNTIPILANVRLIAAEAGGLLKLTSTDLDLQFEQAVPARVEAALAITVDAHRLSEVAGAVEPGAQISLALEDKRLRVKSGRARWLLPVLPVDDFPVLVEEDMAAAVTLPGKRFGEVLARLSPAISTEETRYYLNGVFWHGEEGKLGAAATDGHRLLRMKFGEIDWPADAPSVILMRKFVRTVQSLCADVAEPVTLRWRANRARIEVGDVVLTAKTIDGQFPDYRRIFPPTSNQRLILAPDALAAALRRIRTASTEKTRCVKIERKGDMLLLSCASPDSGAGDEEVPAECEAGFETGFNVAYLADMMASIGGDTVEIHQAGPGDPTLVRRVVDDGMLGVIMPMRV